MFLTFDPHLFEHSPKFRLLYFPGTVVRQLLELEDHDGHCEPRKTAKFDETAYSMGPGLNYLLLTRRSD